MVKCGDAAVESLPYQPDSTCRPLVVTTGPMVSPRVFSRRAVGLSACMLLAQLIEQAEEEVFDERGFARPDVVLDENGSYGIARSRMSLAQLSWQQERRVSSGTENQHESLDLPNGSRAAATLPQPGVPEHRSSKFLSPDSQ